MENIEDRLKPGTDLKEVAIEIFAQYLKALAREDLIVARHSVKSLGVIADYLKEGMNAHDYAEPHLHFGRVYFNQVFCFTGEFLEIDRDILEQFIRSSKGKVAQSVTSNTDFLVLGTALGFGRKLESAVELKVQGHRIGIVTEKHFIKQMAALG